LTALEYLDLRATSLDGTVPEKLCNLRAMNIFVDCDPGPLCSCCMCVQA
jgi:hypothetical protein